MKFICLGYADEKTWAAMSESERNALVDEALSVLDRPAENVVVSLLDLRLEDRPAFLQLLLPRLLEMRAATARPDPWNDSASETGYPFDLRPDP